MHGLDLGSPDGYRNYDLEVVSDKLAMALSVGGKRDCHPSTHVNEDSVAIVQTENFTYLYLADAHHGATAAKLVIDALRDQTSLLDQQLIASFTAETLENVLLDILYPLLQEHLKSFETLSHRHQSKTQLSMMVVNDRTAVWANIGDSRIYRQSPIPSLVPPIIEPRAAFGYHSSKQIFKEKLFTGKEELESGETIIVCSDGFPEITYPQDIPPEILYSWFNGSANAEDACKSFMEMAFELEACDNLSCIIYNVQ